MILLTLPAPYDAQNALCSAYWLDFSLPLLVFLLVDFPLSPLWDFCGLFCTFILLNLELRSVFVQRGSRIIRGMKIEPFLSFSGLLKAIFRTLCIFAPKRVPKRVNRREMRPEAESGLLGG